VAQVQEVGVRCGQGLPSGTGRLRCDAIGHAHGAAGPMVPASTEPARLGADCRVNDSAVQDPELRQVQCGLFLVGSDNSHEVVKDLSHADGSQLCVCPQQCPHLSCGWLGAQEGNDGVSVQDGHRAPARPASSRRAWRLAWSLLGPRVRYLPSSFSTGSSGAGRMTTRSPRSTTITWRVFHRARAPAGMET
jgi:hypothetical protein